MTGSTALGERLDRRGLALANLGSIGIQLGGMAVLAPAKRPVLAGLGIRALIGGTIASILTATIAGVFFQG